MLSKQLPSHLIIPAGTKVVVRANRRVGAIAHAPISPESTYLIRFPDGVELAARREELTIFRHEQALIPGAPVPSDLYRFVAYRCITGSRAYGLATETSDVDRRGFYLPPAPLHWSLAGLPEQLENDNEEVYWEIEKFLRLALKANPNVLECLYSPLIEHAGPIAQELLSIRHIFLSQHVHRTYAIRQGQVEWNEVEEWRLSLHRELDEALLKTSLPEHPDYSRADQYLIYARRLAATESYSQ